MTLRGYVMVVRPPLALLGALASSSLLAWSGRWSDPFSSILLVLTITLGNMGHNAYNEYHDRNTDIAKIYKPFPSGNVREPQVKKLIVTLIGLSAAMNLALLMHSPMYALGFLAHLTSYAYNGLRRDMAGNICMASSYGLAALMSLYPYYLSFVPAFAILTFGFNISTQWQDMPDEHKAGVVTAPMQLGALTSYVAVLLSIFSMIMLASLPLPLGSKTMFISTNLLILVSMIGIFMEKRWMVELLCRWLARMCLIGSFLLLLLGV